MENFNKLVNETIEIEKGIYTQNQTKTTNKINEKKNSE